MILDLTVLQIILAALALLLVWLVVLMPLAEHLVRKYKTHKNKKIQDENNQLIHLETFCISLSLQLTHLQRQVAELQKKQPIKKK